CLWRTPPPPLPVLDPSYFEDVVRLHPDGSIVFARLVDGPTTTTVSVYKVTPAQAAAGPLPATGIPPCATFQLPNNRLPGSAASRGTRTPIGIAVSPPVLGSRDGTILVNVTTPSLRTANSDEESGSRCPETLQAI